MALGCFLVSRDGVVGGGDTGVAGGLAPPSLPGAGRQETQAGPEPPGLFWVVQRGQTRWG